MIFVNCLNTAKFSTNFREFCRVRIEDFPKNHDFEHGFEHCIEMICFSSCSFFVISTSSDDFWLENRYFSTSVANCLNTVIRTVRKLKKQRFSSIASMQQIFRRIFVIFVGSASRIFRKITILNTVLNTVLR